MSRQLIGERLLLRGLEAKDITQRYVDWLNDPEVNQYLETRFARHDLKTVGDFVENVGQNEHEHLFGMFLKTDGRHIGNIKIGPINTHHGFAPVSLFIGDKSCWGKGLATEAIGLVVDHGFTDLGLHKIEAGCYEGNVGSRRAFEKCGFLKEGELRSQRAVDGGRCSDILLGITREDWEERRRKTSA